MWLISRRGYNFLQTQVTTLICDQKQLKKLSAIQSSLKTVQNVIYFEDDGSETDLSGDFGHWKVLSLSEVEKTGKSNPIEPSLPSKNGVAVIMYTSGSTGLPKVSPLSITFS